MSHTRRCVEQVSFGIRAPLSQKVVAAGVAVDAKLSFAANQTICITPLGVGAMQQGEITLRQPGEDDLVFAILPPVTKIVVSQPGTTCLVSTANGARIWTEQSDGDGGNNPP